MLRHISRRCQSAGRCLLARVCVRVLSTVYMCTQEEAALPGIRSGVGKKSPSHQQIARPASARPASARPLLVVWLEPHALCMPTHCKSTHVPVCVCASRGSRPPSRSASTAPRPLRPQGDRGSILEGEISCDTNEGREKCCAIRPDPTYSQ